MAGQGQPPVSLELTNLSCVRGGRKLFERLSLSLRAGDAALVTGANGTGKSSLLRLIAGLLPAESGRLALAGRVALADERPALDSELPLGKALTFWAEIDGGDVARGLSAMLLSSLSDVPVRMLSTGQRRRASLARVIAGGADIWLLDEPANGLDSNSHAQLTMAVAAHRAAGGIVVIASHQVIDLPGVQTVTL